jgi:D-alanyl-D-alanine dipeptidase
LQSPTCHHSKPRIIASFSLLLAAAFLAASLLTGATRPRQQVEPAVPNSPTGQTSASSATSATGAVRYLPRIRPTQTPTAGKTSAKTAPKGKTSVPTTEAPALEPSKPDPWTQITAEPQWSVVYRNPRPATAFVVGAWERFASGQLNRADCVPVNPPDMAAALGFATVDGPDTGGWFLTTGRRLVVKSTDGQQENKLYAYESVGRLGWAIGVDQRTDASARVFWQSGMRAAQPVEAILARALAEAPAAGAWLVAAEVEFSVVRGQTLLRSPRPGRELNASTDKKDPKRSYALPTEETNRPAFLVALVVDPKSRVGGALAARFLPPDTQTLSGTDLRLLAMFGTLRQPAPTPDLTAPLADLWLKVEYQNKQRFPKVLNVQRLLDGSQIRRAYLNVWALSGLAPCQLYQVPDLVDMAEFAPQIERDQKWATQNPLFPEPIYEKPRLVLRREVAEKILKVEKRLNQQGLQLKLYDAYRPFSITQKLYRRYAEELLEKNGSVPEHLLYLASPEVGSRHNRAAAVDCTVTDRQGRELNMPSPYLTFNETSHRTWAGMTPEVRSNMELLTRVMAAEGFTTINEEWWHYDAPGYKSYSILDEPLWPDPQTAAQPENWNFPAEGGTAATSHTALTPNPKLRLALPSDDLRPPQTMETENTDREDSKASSTAGKESPKKDASDKPKSIDLAFLLKLGAVGFVLFIALVLTVASLFKRQ